MRIIIEVCEGEKIEKAPHPEPAEGARVKVEGITPPADLAARAAELGASSAGPAPPEAGIEEPVPFVAEPELPSTAPEDLRDAAGMSAGGAPDFAVGSVEVVEAEPVPEAEPAPEGTD
jgi:hypothetical protein